MRLGRSTGVLAVLAILAIAAIVWIGVPSLTTPTSIPVTPSPGSSTSPQCKGNAACFSDQVTYIVDGDTLDVGSTRIRLALVNTPEIGQPGASEATAFTTQTCSVGVSALVDQDDGQLAGSYGRMVAVVYCGSVNLNAALIQSGLGVLVPYYCSVSEFADEAWTGC